MPFWDPSTESAATGFPHTSSISSSSDGAYTNNSAVFGNVFGDQHLIPVYANGSTRMMPAEERDLLEMDKLTIPPRSRHGGSYDTHLDVTNERRYLRTYWMWVHPLFPVVHKPSFNLAEASPLLRAAMLALGAHVLQTSEDMGNGRIIHERCTKVLTQARISDDAHDEAMLTELSAQCQKLAHL